MYANKLELGIGMDKSVYMTDAVDTNLTVQETITSTKDGKVHLQQSKKRITLQNLLDTRLTSIWEYTWMSN